MAKNQNTFEKRRREHEKKLRKKEKREKRAERKENDTPDAPQPVVDRFDLIGEE